MIMVQSHKRRIALDAQQISQIARQIFDANLQRLPFEPLSGDDKPASLTDAYRIQDEVYALFADEGGLGPLSGHKIALTSKAVQALCGVDQPAYGAIYASQHYASGLTVSAAQYHRLGLEFEVAVRMSETVPGDRTDFDAHSIADYVAACMPAFELIDDRAADYSKLDAASILTDRCWCAGAVLGPDIRDWQSLDLTNCQAELYCNGELMDSGVTGDSMGHPFNGLAWVANHLNRLGRPLLKGAVVITGSALKTQFAEAGNTYTYRIAGLGETSLQVRQ